MYLFGVLGYELLSGSPPYEAKSPTEWIKAHLHGEPRDLRALRPDVPLPLADLLRRCLAREPQHRPSARDVARALQEERADAQAQSADPTDITQLLKRRVPQIVLITVGAGVGLVDLVSNLGTLLPAKSELLTVIFVVAAILASAVLSWFHGAKGKQKAPVTEYVLLGILTIAWIAVSVVAIVR